MFGNLDLRKVLVLGFTSISVSAVLFISSLNAFSTYQSAQSSLRQTLGTSAEIVALRVDGYVGGILGALNAGVIVQGGQSLHVSPALRRQALTKILASHKGLREVWSVNSHGQVREFVSRFAIASSDRLPHLWQPELNKDLEVGDIYFSDILFTGITNEPLINVAFPISRGGQLIGGMVVASISLKYLWDLLSDLHLKETQNSYAFAKTGGLVGHSNRALVFAKNPVPVDVRKAFFRATGGVSREYTTKEGKHVVGGFSLIERLGIGVVVEAPVEEAFEAALGGILQTILVSIAVILVSIGAGVYLARILVRPLSNLGNAAAEISSGNRSSEVEIAGTAETRKLGAIFNKMTRRLSETISQLESEIEAKQETEQVLRENEVRFRSLIENALDIITILDADGTILFISPSVHAILGYKPEELIGQSAWDYFHREDFGDTHRALARNSQDDRKVEAIEGRFLHKNGSWHILDSVGCNLLDNPAVGGIVLNSRDITDRINLEEKLRRSQKMEAVGQLTSGIAHDFNNILGIIQGNLEILEEVVAPNIMALGRIEKAQLGVDRGTDITRKLLGFSRKNSKTFNMTEVNDLIGNLIDLIAKSLTASIKVKVQLGEGIWNVAIDPGELEDAILNLALNARDAMPNGGTLILETANKQLDDAYVRNNPEAHNGDFVMISVSDTGIGMAQELQDKILEPFFTTKELSKGTGLGLSMVYGFVKRSGGHLKIYSEPGKGTTFRFYLPRAAHTAKPANTNIEEQAGLPTGSEKILIVDDEGDLRDIAASYLKGLGYATRTAQSGKQALHILQSETDIEAVFSDVVMPGGLDGYELAVQIHEKYPALNILLTSGFAKTQSEIVNGNREYLDKLKLDLLSKPYNKAELARALRSVLDKSA